MMKVYSSATVICLRRRETVQNSVEQIALKDINQSLLSDRYEGDDTVVPSAFDSGFEVLMGQSEVVNWIRSSPQQLKVMRYAGEFKFAGGLQEEGENFEETARREFEEEFLTSIPDCAILR